MATPRRSDRRPAANDAQIPAEALEVRELIAFLRQRHKPAVRRKTQYGEPQPDLDKRPEHPFDEP